MPLALFGIERHAVTCEGRVVSDDRLVEYPEIPARTMPQWIECVPRSASSDLRSLPRGVEPSYMKKRTQGHNETSISGDTRADWSEAFGLAPSLEVGYVWHESRN